MIVDFEYQPLLEDFYSNSELKIESILKIFENSGSQHSDAAGDKILEGSANGKTWVLTDWYVEIDSFPKYGDKIVAKTWSQGATSLFGTSRDFELYSNQKLCARGTTRWVLFDFNSGRPAKVEKELLEKYGPENKFAFTNSEFNQSKLPKIDLPESFENEIKITPRRNDIDFNNHVHNLVYMDYAMDAIPQDIYKKHNFHKIRITYKVAVKAGEDLYVKYAKNGENHAVFIFGSDNSLKTMIEIS